MMIRTLPLVLIATPALAAPDIVVDLPVTGALVSAVSGAPATVLVEGNADPHHIAMRPSEARAMAGADLVVLIEGVVSAYAEAAETLSVSRLSLSAVVDDHGKGEGHGHEDHGDDHGHDHDTGDEDADHDGADADPDERTDHADHGLAHPWLDPAVATDWLNTIADRLSEMDPAAAATYRANAETAAATIADAAAAARARLADAPAGPLLAVHDAWDDAVTAYGLPVVAAVSDSHAARPGARHLREVEALIADGSVACLLAGTGEAAGSAERFDLPVVTLPLIGVADAGGLAAYTLLIDAIGALGSECPA